MAGLPMRLSQFPFVRVRIRCSVCPKRHGDYALARLTERFGAEADLREVLYELTKGCKWQVPPEKKRRQYVPYCKAAFADLEDETPPGVPPDGGPRRPKLRLVS